MNNGSEFLRQKGEALHWDHSALYTYFKTEIKPYLRNVKQTCFDLLEFYHSIANHNVSLTGEIEQNYEIFIDIYRYQQVHKLAHNVLPPIEVQLMWIVHCMHPVEYFCDSYRRYKKLIDVHLLSIPSKLNPLQHIPALPDFQAYTKQQLHCNNLDEIRCSVNLSTNTNSDENEWFIHNLHMKNSMLQEIEFMNQLHFIQTQHLYSPRTTVHGHGYESSSSSGKSNDRQITQQAIQKAVDRYCKFLYLLALPKDKRPLLCVPTIDVDLVWHAHILNFHDYHAMSKSLFPLIGAIPHRYSLNVAQGMKECWDGIFGAGDYLNGRPFFVDKTVLKSMKEVAKQKKVRHSRALTARNAQLLTVPLAGRKHARGASRNNVHGGGVAEFDQRLNSVESNVKMLSLQLSEIVKGVQNLANDVKQRQMRNEEELEFARPQRKRKRVGHKYGNEDVYDALNALRNDMCQIKQNVVYGKSEYSKNEQGVKQWLSNNVGLPQYLDMFLDNGLDDLDIISDLNDDELYSVGVTKFGHRRKMLKFIALLE